MASNVRVTELDFDQIKENLKTFLRAQSQFSDYDFAGSNLNVLMDLLAYNTHYNAVLANMVSNEMFLDTAIKRSSVVSLAKQINYTPRSVRAARAIIDINVVNPAGSPNFITLDGYTAFQTNIDGEAFTFYNLDSYTTTPSNGTYTFSNVELRQGRRLDYYFNVTNPGPDEKYELPNTDIDTTTLRVSVQNNGVSETYTLSDDIINVDRNSKVFYLQENTQGLYEIYFGDDVLGKKLFAGDIVKVTYLISSGAAANVSTNIVPSWSTNAIAGETAGDRTITNVSAPTGGSAAETADEIRFRSLQNYSSQNRAVTKTDYASIISTELPGAASVNIWGGEDNDPPEYGKTFISIKPKTGYVLTDVEKNRVVNEILKPRGIVTAQHVFAEPQYTELVFKVSVKYNATLTNRNAGQISSLISDKITQFMDSNLDRFNAAFYRSQLEEQIMDVDDAIVSVNVLYDLLKKLFVQPFVRFTAGTLKFPSALHPNELRSSFYYFEDFDGIVYPAQLRDVPDVSPPDYEGSGTLKAYDLNTGNVLEENVGTVNYATGLIVFNAAARLQLAGFLGNANAFYLYAGVQESVGDITPAFNEIIIQNRDTADTLANVRKGITIDIEAVNS